MPRLSPAVLTDADLSPAARSALRLDGQTVPIGPGMDLVADLPECLETRAGGLRSLLLGPESDRRFAVCGRTAAWLHLGWPRLALPVVVAVPVEARLRPVLAVPAIVRELRLAPDETAEAAGLLVTSPTRTLVDLLARGEGGEPEREALLALAGGDPGALLVALARSPLGGGRRAARAWLERRGAQPPLMRYTS